MKAPRSGRTLFLTAQIVELGSSDAVCLGRTRRRREVSVGPATIANLILLALIVRHKAPLVQHQQALQRFLHAVERIEKTEL